MVSLWKNSREQFMDISRNSGFDELVSNITHAHEVMQQCAAKSVNQYLIFEKLAVRLLILRTLPAKSQTTDNQSDKIIRSATVKLGNSAVIYWTCIRGQTQSRVYIIPFDIYSFCWTNKGFRRFAEAFLRSWGNQKQLECQRTATRNWHSTCLSNHDVHQ